MIYYLLYSCTMTVKVFTKQKMQKFLHFLFCTSSSCTMRGPKLAHKTLYGTAGETWYKTENAKVFAFSVLYELILHYARSWTFKYRAIRHGRWNLIQSRKCKSFCIFCFVRARPVLCAGPKLRVRHYRAWPVKLHTKQKMQKLLHFLFWMSSSCTVRVPEHSNGETIWKWTYYLIHKKRS